MQPAISAVRGDRAGGGGAWAWVLRVLFLLNPWGVLGGRAETRDSACQPRLERCQAVGVSSSLAVRSWATCSIH